MEIKTLAQRLLFNTLRIEARDTDDKPVGVGTGFVIAHDLPGYGKELFLVTNKHVVKGAHKATVYVHRVKDGVPDLTNPFFLNIDQFQSTCWGHPSPDVDLVIIPIAWWLDLVGRDGVTAYLTELTTDIIISPEEAAELDAVESVLFVGYPNGMFDTANYVPLFRRGTTASPYQLDYDGRPVFVIDASVFGGSSGSPVFRHTPTIAGQALSVYQLLGVVTEVFYRTDEGHLELRPIPTGTTPVAVYKEMLDLGVVLKAHLIRETIDAWWETHRHRVPELLRFRESMRGIPEAGGAA